MNNKVPFPFWYFFITFIWSWIIWTFIPYLLIMILLGGGQEEFGWRGYALPLFPTDAPLDYAKERTPTSFLDLGNPDIYNGHINYNFTG